MDAKAQEIKSLWEKERTDQSNARSLWQETGDNLYPYVQITSQYAAGGKRTTYLYDLTPYFDMLDMVSGLKHTLIPTGQPFFAVKIPGRKFKDNNGYIPYVVETAHEKILQSNFITEFDEVLRSMIVFGPGDIFSEWTKQKGLNYNASEIGTYIIIEDGTKNIKGSIHLLRLPAIEAYKQFGEKAGRDVVEATKDPKKKNEVFEFLHQITPRENISRNLSRDYNLNMPYESVYINLKEGIVVDEGGFPENPYHIGRWMRPAHEKDGRGIGTELLPQIKVLYQQMKDFIEQGNKWNNAPVMTKDASIEGPVDLSPKARIHILDDNAIQAVPPGVIGNFPITEKSLDRTTEIIHRAFFKQAFAPLENLTGDRRTTLEIRERIRQTLPKLGPPVGRLWVELLDKLLTRSILLEIRNGGIEKPPPEIAGRNFGIEYVGPFALALRSSQAQGFREWVEFVGGMETIFPGAKDNVDSDDAIVRMGHTLGANSEDISTTEERDAKRARREKELQEQKMAMATQLASEAYSKTTKAPEKGSPTESLTSAGK